MISVYSWDKPTIFNVKQQDKRWNNTEQRYELLASIKFRQITSQKP